MKINTHELIGWPLDWAVTKALGQEFFQPDNPINRPQSYTFRPSSNWGDGGAILEREAISTTWRGPNEWWACFGDPTEEETMGLTGPSPLIAAMRCYVASKLGDEVDVPYATTTATINR
jgi:hypothetical protein